MRLFKNGVLVCFALLYSSVMLSAQSPVSDEKDTSATPQKSRIKVPLLREGYLIIEQKAKLAQHPEDGRWFLLFKLPQDMKPDTRITTVEPIITETQKNENNESQNEYSWPIEVLPGKWLTSMTKLSAKETNMSIVYRVWGEITTYNKRNYILPTRVDTLYLFGNAGQNGKSDNTAGRSSILNRIYGVQEEEEEENKPDDAPDNVNLSENMREMLLAIPRSHTLETENETLEGGSKTEPASDGGIRGGIGTEKKEWREGVHIKDRVGRLNFDFNDNTYKIIFESQSEAFDEPPVIVHPNMLLAVLKNKMQRSRQFKFRISGMITRYQGRYYILLRKVMIVYDRGNLGK